MRRRITLLHDPERRTQSTARTVPGSVEDARPRARASSSAGSASLAVGAPPRVLVARPPLEAAATAGARIWDEIEALERACRQLGHVVTRAELSPDPAECLALVRETRAELVLPLIARGLRAAQLASLLEWSSIACTGARATALAIVADRGLAHALLRARGVPVPRAFLLEAPDDPLPDLGLGKRWRVRAARPEREFEAQLVSDAAELRELARRTLARATPALFVDEHVDGREFRVCIVGSASSARVLPPGALAAPDSAGGGLETRAALAAERLPASLDQTLRSVALAALDALSLSGHTRFDLRLCAERGPLLVDLHANCDLEPSADLARAAAREGWPYEQLVDRIAADGIANATRR